MPGVKALWVSADHAKRDTRPPRRKSERQLMTGNMEVDEDAGRFEKSEDRSSPKIKKLANKPVKIKVELIDDDDENEDMDHDDDRNSYSPSEDGSSTRSTTRRRIGLGVANGDMKGCRRRSDNSEEADELHTMAVEQDDAASDDFNQQDRYSPFDGMSENPESDDFSPIQDRDGNVMLDVDCGANSALLYVNKLCQGSKGQCILFEDRWYTPNEFQFISGRETAKDWKRSIRHRGKSLKILMGRGLLRAHPLMCECDTCRQNFALKGGLRIGDRRIPIPSAACNNNGTMAAVDRSRIRRNAGPDGEGGHLSDIIDQLQHGSSNGYSNGRAHHHAYEGSRKRTLGVDHASASPTNSSPSSMSAPCGLALVKRPRSISPREDDIYDEQQRKIFEAANSPEPQNIENLRRSLNLSSSRSNSPSGGSVSPNNHHHQQQPFYGGIGSSRGAPTVAAVSATINGRARSRSPSAGPADLSNRNASSSPPSGSSVGSSGLVLVSQPPQMMSKHQSKSRKQTAPQHLNVDGNTEEAHSHRSQHIVLSSFSGQPYNKANAAVRPRYQSTPVFNHRNSGSSSNNYSATQHHHSTGSSGELNLSTNGNSSSRRSHSGMTPSVRPPGTPVKMIELTRPEIVPASGGGRPSSANGSSTTGDEGGSQNPGHPSISNGDAVFLPEDMTSWTVSDVTQFVQSLKGCEEYTAVFREQAIDGEILPVLTEDHLLHNMGLKLGPALKIRLHVARRLGFTLDGQYCNAAPATSPLPPTTPQPTTQSQSQQTQAQSTPQKTPKRQTASPAPQQSTTPVPTCAGSRPSTPSSAGQKSSAESIAEDDE